MSQFDLIIIGGGPSGINCAIEATARGLDYILLEKGVLVNSLFNFPANMQFFSTSRNLEIGSIPFISHTDKPTRKEALEYYRRLYDFYQLNVSFKTRVDEVHKKDEAFEVTTSKGIFYAKYLVCATGFYDHPNKLNIQGEDLPKVKHYYDEAHHYIGQKVVVVGGANSACDVALETWQKGAEVTMVIRKPALYDKVKYWILPNIENRIKEGSIQAFFNSSLISISDDKVDIKTPKGIVEIENDFVLAMTGYRPDYALLSAMGVEISSDQFQTPKHNVENFESNIPNLFLMGTVLGGLKTSKYFIENTREQAETVVSTILKKESSQWKTPDSC